MAELLIGYPQSDHIKIRVLRRSHPEADDYWDGNWVNAEVSLVIRPWQASYDASLRTEELTRFRDAIRELYRGERREATLTPLEPWLFVTLEVDSLGHVHLGGAAGPEGHGRPFGAVQLNFEVKDFMDQTFLPPLIGELDEIVHQFPVIGDPTK